MLGCMACDGNSDPDELEPRERVLLTPTWRVAHAFDSALAGWLVILPRRHVTALHELTPAEAVELGPIVHKVSAAVAEVTGCLKAYLAFFAEKEGFAHLHIHVIPRMPDFTEELTGPRVFELLKRPRSEWVPEIEQDRIASQLGSLISAMPP